VNQIAQDRLAVGGRHYRWLDLRGVLPEAALRRLPYSLRVLVENTARCHPEALSPLLDHLLRGGEACEIPFQPNRLMLHDTTCLPAMADFAGLRDAVAELGGDPGRLNPRIPVVLTIDHSVIVERYATPDAVEVNLDIDYRRNGERYRFIKWAEQSVQNFKVVPPGTGIIHQVNMESLATVVWEVPAGADDSSSEPLLHPDAMVATDSHTPMINALGVVAWGVGGLEGQAAMLGEPVPIVCPEVVGVAVRGSLRPGVTATDVALHLTELFRRTGVVGKFIEFTGGGLDQVDWGMRATIANMAPEYGATVVYFPFDSVTLDYLRLTGRSPAHCELVETYMRAQNLWRNDDLVSFDEDIDLDLSAIEPCVAGPYLPQQRQQLCAVASSFQEQVIARHAKDANATFLSAGFDRPLAHGSLVMAAITSCTNTANPRLMIQAGLLARNAHRRGLQVPPWVKTSLSPGSRVVSDYLTDAGLMPGLESLGFHIVGFGCMTCIGSSGPLEPRVDELVDQGLLVAGVLSGNRNFEGRVHPKLAGGYLASPPLVIAYAIAGTVMIDIGRDPIANDAQGKSVYLKDLWPPDDEIEEVLHEHMKADFFVQRNRSLWTGTHHWGRVTGSAGVQYAWEDRSTYLRRPTYTRDVSATPDATVALRHARVLAVLGDNITTDHISPVGTIPADSAAGAWLLERGERREDLNQYSTRRSNHEVMLRGAFTTRNLKNLLLGAAQPTHGMHARSADGTAVLPVYQAAATYRTTGTPLVVFAGINYGAGSSRDWAAKAQAGLGVRAVVAVSFERIHRSNLIGMGVMPLQFKRGQRTEALNLTGEERVDFEGFDALAVGCQDVTLVVSCPGQEAIRRLTVDLRIDSTQELDYLRHGGILPFVMRKALHGATETHA
jgi:aconitate hydratase